MFWFRYFRFCFSFFLIVFPLRIVLSPFFLPFYFFLLSFLSLYHPLLSSRFWLTTSLSPPPPPLPAHRPFPPIHTRLINPFALCHLPICAASLLPSPPPLPPSPPLPFFSHSLLPLLSPSSDPPLTPPSSPFAPLSPFSFSPLPPSPQYQLHASLAAGMWWPHPHKHGHVVGLIACGEWLGVGRAPHCRFASAAEG